MKLRPSVWTALTIPPGCRGGLPQIQNRDASRFGEMAFDMPEVWGEIADTIIRA